MRAMKLWLLSMVVVGGGIAHANNHKYPWCADIADKQGSVTDGNEKFVYNSDADDLKDDGLVNVALASCGNASSDMTPYDSKLTAARERWSKRLELSDAEWKDVAAYTTHRGGSPSDAEIQKRGVESLTPLEQFDLIANADGRKAGGEAWMTDILGSHLSETGRLAFLERCIEKVDPDPVEMASCAPDAAVFDAHKVFAEMHADTSAHAGKRIKLRLLADRIRRAIPKFKDRVAALVKQDPAYGKMFDIATDTAKEWNAMYAANDPNVDLAFHMDHARLTNSRKAFDGCGPRVVDAWRKAVSAIPAKRFAKIYDDPDGTNWFRGRGMPIALQNPDAYLAGYAMAICGSDSKDKFVGEVGGEVARESQRWTGNRGPRASIVTRVTSADLQFDDRSVTLEQPTIDRGIPSGEGGGGGGLGVLAKVTPKGKMLHVEFVLKAEQGESCAEGSFSHRIEAIHDNGTIQYHYDCRKWKTVTMHSGSPPIDIDATYAGSLKAGMRASIINGVVDAAWPSAKSDTPVIVFGAPVK